MDPFPCLALPTDYGGVTMAVSELPSAHPFAAVEAGLGTERRSDLVKCSASVAAEG